MEKGKEDKEKKFHIALVTILIILLMGVCVAIGYAIGGVKTSEKILKDISEKNNNQENTKEIEETKEESIESEEIVPQATQETKIKDFDFDEMEKTLKEAIKDEKKTPFIQKCTDKSSEETGPSADYEKIDVSANTINSIIQKLREAESVEKNITASWFGCPPKSIDYYISDKEYTEKKLYVSYATAENKLLVGYKDTGYAFQYTDKSAIENFLESLQ